MDSRRNFIKKTAIGTAGLAVGVSAKSYSRILGANDRVRVGIVGFADRTRQALIPAFMNHAKEMNFEIVAVSDLWNRRRDEGEAFIKEKTGAKSVFKARNNEELYEKQKDLDAVLIATADFQHALHCKEAVEAGKDAYVEKPFAESIEDGKIALEAVERTQKIVQIGSQRRSGSNYIAAAKYVKEGKFGDIKMVEMTWNVNQPGRWRRPDLVAGLKKEDVDWDRYLMNRPKVAWDPRKYLEYRLFWPYSSGIPGQWMSHQIDTVNWFSGFDYPRSVVANGGIYMWNDGRENHDCMTAVFDYGPANDLSKGFQVLYSSRMFNEAGGVKEIYFSNGGTLNLDTNKVTAQGGLRENHAKAMNMQANLLADFDIAEAVKAETSANTGADPMTSAHMRNWMECVRSRKEPNAPAKAGLSHSVANLMCVYALQTGKKVTFDGLKREIVLS